MDAERQQEQWNKAVKLAQDTLILSRNTLLVNLRFLDAALSQFELVPVEESSLLTDGQDLYYNPLHVLNTFKLQQETVVRDYLHVVLHCVFRHMFMDPSLDRPLWDLACDVAVEATIAELGLRAVDCTRGQKQTADLEQLRGACPMLTAEKVYNYLKSSGIDPLTATDIRSRFYADNHEIWYMSEEEKYAAFGIGQADGDGTDNGNEQSDGEGQAAARAALSAIWEQIAQRMQVDMETFGKKQGDAAGSLLQNLREVNREKYDYTAFLKKFAVMGEAMKINDDEFDYVFYTYGLQLYERMPLIEPLEYKEVKRIKEFVIAIDTSGSVMGEQVQAFVQKTYNILKSTESFFSKINLHIIQCDADIQEHVKITNQEEFDRYLETMQLKGFGGTDFRPVFEKVNQLVADKEFVHLKGLIYFTDGYGEFPARKPDYETAFVFVRDGYEIPEVPPWAIKLILEPNDI